MNTSILKRLIHHRNGRIGVVILGVFFVAALLGRWIAPHDPLIQDLYQARLAPSFLAPPFLDGGQSRFLLGTDDLGRDILSRLLHGASLSLLIGLISVGLSLLAGIPMGLAAAYFGGRIDIMLSRAFDVMLSLPSLLLAIIISAVLGPSLENAMIAIGIVNTPHFARVMRAQALQEKSREYYQAATAIGAGHLRLMYGVLLPNALAPLIVQATMGLSVAILEAAALSFVGLGAQAPTPEWGAMIHAGRNYFHNAWWIMAFPGLAIFLTSLGFNLLGDGLRDVLDPRLRSSAPTQHSTRIHPTSSPNAPPT